MERSREDEIRERLDEIAGPEPGPPERALLARLIRSFSAKTPAGVDHLAQLMRGGAREAVRDQAHGLKGSAANIGAERLSAIFAEVEHSARDGAVPDPDVTLGWICSEQALVLGTLEKVAAELET
jgi:HPt (histidine-containing phosphotransfer) domain-containing protein